MPQANEICNQFGETVAIASFFKTGYFSLLISGPLPFRYLVRNPRPTR